jgi:hypothetical protein
VEKIGLLTGDDTWVHDFTTQTKQAEMHFGLLKQHLGGCQFHNNV